jgi:hypothetical protein
MDALASHHPARQAAALSHLAFGGCAPFPSFAYPSPHLGTAVVLLFFVPSKRITTDFLLNYEYFKRPLFFYL